MASLTQLWSRLKVWIIAVAAGCILGIVYRLWINFMPVWKRSGWAPYIMTIAFLAIVPFAMGYLGVRKYLSNSSNTSWYRWLFLPWASVLVTMLVSVAVKWEGALCLIFAGPIMLVSSLLGGITARILRGKYVNHAPGTMSAYALPLLLILIESQIPSPYIVRTVNTEILIHASSQAVWDNIKSVRAISPAELPASWINRIGFPRPIAATLSHEGIGGVRQASFTGGLVFTETVHQWQPEQDLAFSIHANTDAIPRTTLDEHVTIGGPFFDVLDGEYRLEPRPDGVLLHLSSRQRLSTHLNPYASLWTDSVMRAIQNQILVVIQHRCEASSHSQTSIGLRNDVN
jgi:hypothetical protein